MPISISKLPEVTNVKDNSFMLITQDGTTKRTMCDQFVTEEEARLDEFSPTVITSKSMSKTGEGDNIDYSSSVYDATMKDIILKGKTMVNCIQEPSSQDVVLPYEFEDGQYVTINDTKESGTLGVELKGQTLVNSVLFIDKTLPYTWVSNNISSRTCSLRGNFKTGTYALIVDFGEVLLGGVQSSQGVSCSIQVNYTNGTLDAYMRNGLENYSNKRLFTPFNINNEVSTIEFKGVSEQYENATTEGYIPPTVTVNKIMIIEYQEGMENWDIPYFTGMTSCKMPILSTVGKNLFDGIIEKGNINISNGEIIDGNTSYRSVNYTKIKMNTIYFIQTNQNTPIGIRLYDVNKNFISSNSLGANSYFNSGNAHFVKFVFVTTLNLENIQLEEGSTATSYESYKASSLSLPEEVVLRSLPNGVCDTFNTRTGVYTQRVGAMVLNGSDPITSRMQQTENVLTTTSRCYLDYASIPSDISMKPFSSANGVSNKLICDILPVKAVVPNMQQDDIESVGQTTAGFSIRVKGKTIAECRQRLAEQPVTIQYELATPIITKINLSSTLKPWNTTTHIYSEIPENSLYPILSHSNPTYPVILKPSTKYSIVVNSYSNDHTNSAINFNLGGATASTTVGSRVTTITTPSTLSNELLTMSGRGNKLNNVMVIEGDVAGDEPYFEGICDCKSPILSNCGKNLFDGKIELGGIGSNGIPYDSDVLQRSMNFTRVSPNTTYKISDTSAIDGFNIIEYDFNKNIIERNWMGNKPFTTKTNCHYVKWFNSKVDEERFVIIEQGSYPSPYEPYKSNTTTFEQKDDKTIVLRSLPSGVCDTLNMETGEYVQRIGEVMLNGSEQWSSSGYVSQNHYCAFTSIENSKNVPSYDIMCNSFPVRGVLSTDVDYEGCML
ncbi:MAG: hypothetical protein J6D33_01075, partial [Turicibacter sp.]|nr:hypothetical protein [Turicibacter sp.]